mmetsp:Transcript_90294/g.254839  ORF Transcript_90294/g.254839 Transcript_90294/m.254839 type:complete len:185 (-) Transcript_90294:298-852(-)
MLKCGGGATEWHRAGEGIKPIAYRPRLTATGPRGSHSDASTSGGSDCGFDHHGEEARRGRGYHCGPCCHRHGAYVSRPLYRHRRGGPRWHRAACHCGTCCDGAAAIVQAMPVDGAATTCSDGVAASAAAIETVRAAEVEVTAGAEATPTNLWVHSLWARRDRPSKEPRPRPKLGPSNNHRPPCW